MKFALEVGFALATACAVVAIVLALASRRRRGGVDETPSRVLAALPGANCGACGNATCFMTAQAIATGRMGVNGCSLGGETVADQVAKIMDEPRKPADSAPVRVAADRP